MNRKGIVAFSATLAIVIVLVVAGIVWYYYARQFQPDQAHDIAPYNPTPSSSMSETVSSSTNLQKDAQWYRGSNFSFQYPALWLVSGIGDPSKKPTSCGDSNGDASSCISLDPPQFAAGMKSTVFVMVFNTSSSPLNWCSFRGDALASTCRTTTVNGYPAMTASSSPGDFPVAQYEIVEGNGVLIVFATTNPDYKKEFTAIVNSITFQ